MIENWRVNAVLGLLAFIFTFTFSLINNTWITSLFRAGIGFIVFFIFAYILRIVMYQIISKKNADFLPKQNREKESSVESVSNTQIEDSSIDNQSFQAVTLQSLHNGKD